MRISVDKNDPGYSAYQRSLAEGFDYVIELDGKRVKQCVMADDIAGEIVAFRDGPFYGNPIDPSAVWTETRRGRVTITRRWKAKQS